MNEQEHIPQLTLDPEGAAAEAELGKIEGELKKKLLELH